MILFDTNALVVLIVGLIDENLIEKHKRTSLYTKNDFYNLIKVIENIENLIVLPNIWTEVDNLLNNFSGNNKYHYINNLKQLIEKTTENYLSTSQSINSEYFSEIGITDSLILQLAEKCNFIITSDTKLSDYANANGIKVYDMIKRRNQDFK
ncbi:PIN domain-containing protein [Flavobacterium agrisoli]|uniref:PIN domain-containing protein n=1 Tax=Flavobacterium agrisoli TaxID=2793066 RepID=A0A934PLS6_9FLAO|nr:hypothetical protein [Flavobacterium agrisoli]MBK0369610.1 hypothetical protein [Flavobacterium agrisoli]